MFNKIKLITIYANSETTCNANSNNDNSTNDENNNNSNTSNHKCNLNIGDVPSLSRHANGYGSGSEPKRVALILWICKPQTRKRILQMYHSILFFCLLITGYIVLVLFLFFVNMNSVAKNI